MKFEMWSFGHWLFILSPFIVIALLWIILRNKSEKTKRVFDYVIGITSLLILVVRNIDIFIRNGFDPEIVPLQVCHIGNITVFIALLFKSKISASILWCLNLPAAFSSLIVADALEGYQTIFAIRPQAYIWGHLLIIVGAIYTIAFKRVKIDLKSFFIGVGVIIGLLIPAIIFNSYFNDVLGFKINYFYIYDSHGVPFGFIYNLGTRSTYGWFTINWTYTLILSGAALPLLYLIYLSQKLFYIREGKKEKLVYDYQ